MSLSNHYLMEDQKNFCHICCTNMGFIIKELGLSLNQVQSE
jgi:hypothetical protein